MRPNRCTGGQVSQTQLSTDGVWAARLSQSRPVRPRSQQPGMGSQSAVVKQTDHTLPAGPSGTHEIRAPSDTARHTDYQVVMASAVSQTQSSVRGSSGEGHCLESAGAPQLPRDLGTEAPRSGRSLGRGRGSVLGPAAGPPLSLTAASGRRHGSRGPARSLCPSPPPRPRSWWEKGEWSSPGDERVWESPRRARPFVTASYRGG